MRPLIKVQSLSVTTHSLREGKLEDPVLALGDGGSRLVRTGQTWLANVGDEEAHGVRVAVHRRGVLLVREALSGTLKPARAVPSGHVVGASGCAFLLPQPWPGAGDAWEQSVDQYLAECELLVQYGGAKTSWLFRASLDQDADSAASTVEASHDEFEAEVASLEPLTRFPTAEDAHRP